MRRPRIAQLDLNLLKVFVAVYRERHITRAGRILFMTQSAVSHALGRLRELFGDPLFIRTPEGMRPTALADRLADPIQHALRTVEEALAAHADFEPSTARLNFTVGTQSAQPFVFLPDLYRRLEGEAPNVGLYVKLLTATDLVPQLDAGTVDVAIGLPPSPGSLDASRFESEPLMEDPLVCVTSAQNPEVGDTLDLATYARLPHLVVAADVISRTWIDEALAAHDLRRRIAVIVPHPHAIALMLPRTRLICTVARSIAMPFVGTSTLRLLVPPIHGPIHTAHLVWHSRSSRDPAQRWMRSALREACAGIQPDTLAFDSSRAPPE
jgi:DNA-binding transcriptional LysR family regulator